MLKTCALLICLLSLTRFYSCLKVSFISWNANDNKRFAEYNAEIVSSLLKLDSVGSSDLPDIYAISFQENCHNCQEEQLTKLANPFIDVLQTIKEVKYKFVSISATRRSSVCEIIYCMSKGSLHGTTLMMVLAKETVKFSNIFEKSVKGCTDEMFRNDEKGVAVSGVTIGEIRFCFGGLHLDVAKVSSRRKCMLEIMNKIDDKCDIIFLGGDFNTRPKSKDTPKPSFYEGGFNQSFFDEMKVTDDFSGSDPYSGGDNLITYIREKTGFQFAEPFKKAPDFIPTYSIDSSIKCPFAPVCFRASKYPSWTDRIIYSPVDKVSCTEYSSIQSLATLSDHLPVFATCDVN